jgi:hypothetical protein
MERGKQATTLGQRWSEVRPTKALVAWSCVGSIVLTMIVGFTWGGWVRGATAVSMAEAMAEDAVVKRLAPICVVQVGADPAKDEKLKVMNDLNSYERGEYVQKQGWASMPGEKEPDRKVADACAKLLAP